MHRSVGVVVCGLLLSCGGGGGSSTGGAGGSATGGVGGLGGTGASGGGSPGAPGAIAVRVANVFLQSGTTSGLAIDIYDDMYNYGFQPSASGKPLIAGLPYGTMSGYVNPRFVNGNGAAIQLVALPAGSPSTDTTDARVLWGGTDDGSHPQLTLLLTNEGGDDGGPLSGFAYSDFYEKGEAPYSAVDRAPLAPPPPSGQGEYLVSLDAVGDPTPANPTGGYFFFVDDSCTPPLNGYPNLPGVPLVYTVGGVSPGDFSQFATIPNPHQISVVAWNEPGTPTCSDLLGARQGATTVSVAAGQQIITFIYGSSLTDLHLLTGPIAP